MTGMLGDDQACRVLPKFLDDWDHARDIYRAAWLPKVPGEKEMSARIG